MKASALRKRLTPLIEKWAARLGIGDYAYIVEIKSDQALRGNYAEVDTDDEAREVTIAVNKQRLSREPHEVEKTIIHELLHTRLNEYAELVITILNECVENPKPRRVFKRQLEKLEHKIVVALTDALVKGE